jgi:hypothetical protein
MKAGAAWVHRAGYDTAMRFHEESGLLNIEAPSYDDFVATDTIDEALSSSR